MKNFKNILVVRTDRFGDVVLTTPAIQALREAYPQAKITILVAPATQDLIEGYPYLDEIIIDDKMKEHKGLAGFYKLINVFRKKKFDLAVVFHTKKRTNALCFLAGIPYRIGYKNKKFGFLLNHPVEDMRHQGKKHEAQYCLDVLTHIGIASHHLDIESNHLKLYVAVKEECQQWVQKYFRQNNITEKDRVIAIHPGASDSSKRWSEKLFAELIDKLIEQYSAKIIITGVSETRNIARRILSLTHAGSARRFGPIFDLTGMTTICQLVSLLKQCNLLISNDSGPVHIATGVGTPVVSIFTRNQPGINPERWRPLGKNSRVISVPYNDKISFAKARSINATNRSFCGILVHPGKKKGSLELDEGSELIRTQEVLEAVDSIFKLC